MHNTFTIFLHTKRTTGVSTGLIICLENEIEINIHIYACVMPYWTSGRSRHVKVYIISFQPFWIPIELLE